MNLFSTATRKNNELFFWKSRLRRLTTAIVLLIGIFLILVPTQAAEKTLAIVSWASAEPGIAPATLFDTGILELVNSEMVIAGNNTEPPSPLPGEQMLFVVGASDSTDRARFNLEAKPFAFAEAPATGWIEFQVSLSEMVRLYFGAGGSSGTILTKSRSYDGTIVASFLISPSGKSFLLTTDEGKEVSKPLGLVLPPNSPFTLRVSWSISPQTIDITFQVNGEDAHQLNGQLVAVSIPNSESATGIDYFRFSDAGSVKSLREGGFFLGKITAGFPSEE